jgi:TRAP-type C4-dicarboxylate transport system permease small subunit
MRIPNWTVQVIVPVGCVLAVVFCVLNIARDLGGDPGFVEEGDDTAPR